MNGADGALRNKSRQGAPEDEDEPMKAANRSNSAIRKREADAAYNQPNLGMGSESKNVAALGKGRFNSQRPEK